MSDAKVLVIVSNDASDIYFANELMRHLHVVGVVVENQLAPKDTRPLLFKFLRYALKPRSLLEKIYDVLIGRRLRRHAPYNQAANKADFGSQGERLDKALAASQQVPLRYTEGVNDINDAQHVDWIRELKPDVIAVCGASILGTDILGLPPKGVINLHGGLAQKYRGLFTTDWAIFNEEPEYVGATVHYVSPGIDSGEVIFQGRPEVELGDTPNSLYVKVVKLGVKMMVKAIENISDGVVQSVPLPECGELYLGRQYTHRIKAATWRKLNRGVIESYLANRAERDEKVLGGLLNEFPMAQR